MWSFKAMGYPVNDKVTSPQNMHIVQINNRNTNTNENKIEVEITFTETKKR